MSRWPAQLLANATSTCKELYGLLDLVIDVETKRMSCPLPPPRELTDSRTRRLHFLQRLTSRRAHTLSAGAWSSLCLAGGKTSRGEICRLGGPCLDDQYDESDSETDDDADPETQLLSWGGKLGEEALPSSAAHPSPVPVGGLLSSRFAVREVAAGSSHCLLLTTSGQVFSWGADNSCGQLGHGHTAAVATPTLLEALRSERVMQVACGYEHSLVLTATGIVHSFGRGSLGRLGLGGEGDSWTPQPLTRVAHARERDFEAQSVDDCAVDGERMPRVTLVTAGLFHSMAVSESGSLYSWGSGTNGRLGHGDTVMQLRPRRVEALGSVEIVSSSAGAGHSVAISSSGELFSWGQGYGGRLGHGNQAVQLLPQMVEALRREAITSAVAGSEFTVALTAKGAAYSFGTGDMTGSMWWGRGWAGGSLKSLEPVRIKALSDVRLTEAAAGMAHTLLRDSSGQVFTFGAGHQGQLGHGNFKEQLVPKAVELVPKAVELPLSPSP